MAIAAMAAGRAKVAYLAALYQRLAGRRGKARARKAIGHSILVAIHHMLSTQTAWQDLGPDWFQRRHSPQVQTSRLHELKALGCQVVQQPDGTVIVTPPCSGLTAAHQIAHLIGPCRRNADTRPADTTFEGISLQAAPVNTQATKRSHSPSPLSPHLARYQRSLANYARLLLEPER